MTKKFDVVIGNPPYQEEARGDGTRDTPIYHLFMDAAYEVGTKVVLITPARFLFNAGFTPKAWNGKMLTDPHLTVPRYVANSDDLFPGTDIKGGIAVTYRDADRPGEPIGTFTTYPELNTILRKVLGREFAPLSAVITTSRSFGYTSELYADHPDLRALRPKGNEGLVESNAFMQFRSIFHETRPEDGHGYVQVLGMDGRSRALRWIREDYFDGPFNLRKHKVALPKANGSGALGEKLSSPAAIGPGIGTTHTFITIGSFDSGHEALSCLKYIKTKFARIMLGVSKITQDNSRHAWTHVPLQDFTSASDIDWSLTVAGIDRQLYARYGLDGSEIEFIESHAEPMD